MKDKSPESPSKLRLELQALAGQQDIPKVPLWKMRGYYKKGQLVRRRRTRMESRQQADKKYGMGLVMKEVSLDDKNWHHVEVYWQAMGKKVVEKKSDIERVVQKVEQVVLPQRKK